MNMFCLWHKDTELENPWRKSMREGMGKDFYINRGLSQIICCKITKIHKNEWIKQNQKNKKVNRQEKTNRFFIWCIWCNAMWCDVMCCDGWMDDGILVSCLVKLHRSVVNEFIILVLLHHDLHKLTYNSIITKQALSHHRTAWIRYNEIQFLNEFHFVTTIRKNWKWEDKIYSERNFIFRFVRDVWRWRAFELRSLVLP